MKEVWIGASIEDVSHHRLPDLISLAGRSAVVTGGGHGLSKAIADRLTEAGANVPIGDVDEVLADCAAADLASKHSGRSTSG